MVWGLFPVDPLPGEDQYYIFSKGTYKVGRKGCDIIISKDKGVSRVHAELVIDEMLSVDDTKKKASNISSRVRIIDCSKYGTFISKNLGLKQKVHESPNKEIMLMDGDLLSFGTGNATYRFCFVPLIFFICSFKTSEMKQLEENISLIGASISQSWTSHCTHMVINDLSSITYQIIDAVVAKKTLVLSSWIEFIAGKTICTEIPSSLSHAPSLLSEGVNFKVTDPQSQEHCLRGYTFLLESIQKYKFKEKLQLLLELGGAKVVFTKILDPDSQSLREANGQMVRVIPTGVTCTKSVHSTDLLPNVKEIEIVSAVFSGSLDPSIIVSAPVLVTSSCSTDETFVADSDVDMEAFTSIHTSVVIDVIESAENVCENNMAIPQAELGECDLRERLVVHAVESLGLDSCGNTAVVKSSEHETQGFIPSNRAKDKPDSSYSTAAKSNAINDTLLRDKNDGIIARTSKSENLDIIFSQDLIVRDSTHIWGHTSTKAVALNFKRFRKNNAPSGNSFNNLVPFSKYPYGEADYGNEDVSESVKEEKKRKQMEAIADDLFNYEKGRRRGPTATLTGLFARN